jgi:hypothetical protein
MTRFRPVHWTARFFTSIRPGRPAPEDEVWAKALLTEREGELFGRMSNPDRRHAIGVAREVDRTLPAGIERRDTVLAAALLHDIGKTVSGLRSYGRVIATLSGAVVGGRVFAEFWQDSSGFTRKVGLYMRYPILGAEMLQLAGSDPWVIAWAREHHESEDDWTVPVEVFRVVEVADR